MDCKNCRLTEICSVSDMVKKFSMQMDITVSNCTIKDSSITSKPLEPFKEIETPVISQRPLKTYTNFRDISNQMRNEEKGWQERG